MGTSIKRSVGIISPWSFTGSPARVWRWPSKKASIFSSMARPFRSNTCKGAPAPQGTSPPAKNWGAVAQRAADYKMLDVFAL